MRHLATRGRKAPTDAVLFLIAVVRVASKIRVPGRSALGLLQLLVEVVHALAQVVDEACAALLADLRSLRRQRRDGGSSRSACPNHPRREDAFPHPLDLERLQLLQFGKAEREHVPVETRIHTAQ